MFNAAQIIGKTLIAAAPVNLKRAPYDAAEIVYTVSPPNAVGVVDSYVMPREGRTNLWWSFFDKNGNPYYAEQLPGAFSEPALQEQGLLTTQQQTEAAAKANETIKDFIERNIKYIVIVIAGVVIIKTFIQTRAARRT